MRCAGILATTLMFISLTGCKTGGVPILNLLPSAEAIKVIYVTDSPQESAFVLRDYEGFRKAMSTELSRTVRLEPAFPILAEPGLRGGWQDFAIMTPLQYAQLKNAEEFPVTNFVGVSGDGARPGVFVVLDSAPFEELANLRDHRVAFGPKGIARMYQAPLRELAKHGVERSDLKRQVVPVPGSLLHLKDDAAIVDAVQKGTADAGVVDAAYFAAGGTAEDVAAAARSKGLRVIGTTMAVPDRLVVCSPKIASDAIAQTRDFLATAEQRYPNELDKAGLRGFTEVEADLLPAIRSLR